MPSADDMFTRFPGVFTDTVAERAALDLVLTEAGLRVSSEIFGLHTSEATMLLAAHLRMSSRAGALASGATSMSADGVSVTYGQIAGPGGAATSFLAEFNRIQKIVALTRRFVV